MRLLPAPLVVLALSGCNVAPSPALVAIDPEVADTTADLHAVVTAEALDLNKGDDVTYRYEWSQNGVVRTDLTSDTVPADATTRGDTWSVVVYAEDGKAEGPGSSASVSIVDAVPVASTPELDPPDPRSNQDVTCVGHAEDADAEALSFTYAWYVGGVALTSDATLKHQDFHRGDTVYCTATPYDGEQHGDAAKSAVVVIADAPPVITGLVLSTSSPQRGDDLSVTASSTDFEGDPVTYAYAWYVDGALAGSAQALTGAALERGEEVYVVVTPNDGTADGDPVESEHLTVGNTPAEVDGVSLSPSPAYTNDTLTATIGDVTDADGDPATVTYTWKVDGKVVQTGGLDTLDGAKWFSKDQVVTVEVTADDGSGAGPAATASLSIANTAPTMTGASISSTDVYEASTVRCTGSGFSDVDGDGTQYKYAWYVNGVVSTDTARDIDGTYFDKHDDVYCVVSPYDGTDAGASKTTSTFTVQNTPPTPAVVAILPDAAASDGDDLQCTLSTASTDEDGDSITYTYAWTEDGVAISETSSVLIGDLTNVGSSYVCVATPNDGEANGDPSPDSSATTVYPIAGNSSLSIADVRIDGASSSTYLGQPVVMGDYDGDGVQDLLIGLDGGSQEKAYVFLGPLSAGTLTASKADVVFSPSVSGYKFGQNVAAAGDFDGDGLDDVMVGATSTSVGGKGNAGAAYVFSGGATGPFTSADAITEIEGSGNGEQVGYGMAALGDVDGDGIDDLGAGALQADPSSVTDAGELMIVLGGTTPPATVTATTADALITGVNTNDWLGYDVIGPGDVNGDGYDDVTVSAHGYDGGSSERGAYFTLYGPLSGTLPVNKNVDVAYIGAGSSSTLGSRKPAALDYDGDGAIDMALPAPNESGAAGAVYVVLNVTSGTVDLSTTYDVKMSGTSSSTDLGWGIARVSDLDGDGDDELLLGAPYYDYTSGTTTTSDVGLVMLEYGGGTGSVTVTSAPLRLRGERVSDYAGRWLTAGDLNDDGVDDLVIGAPYADGATVSSDAGSVYVVFGQ